MYLRVCLTTSCQLDSDLKDYSILDPEVGRMEPKMKMLQGSMGKKCSVKGGYYNNEMLQGGSREKTKIWMGVDNIFHSAPHQDLKWNSPKGIPCCNPHSMAG